MRFYDIGESPLMGHSEKHIAPLVLGGLIAAGASLAGNAIGASSQNKTNQTSIDINRENNAFNAEQAQIQRNWQEKMWGMNNSYNSPNAMISRGLNPFVQGSAAMAGSKSPASGGAVASSAGMPSLQAFRPDFSDVGSALASMAQARASMINAEQNAALTPYRINQILGDTNYRNIGVGQSGYWNASTGRRSALLDQSKEYQELKNMEFAGRLTSAQESQILLDSKAQQILNKYLDEQQQADLFIKGQTLANLYAQGVLSEAQYKNQMAQAVKASVETNGIRISNRIAEGTADSLIKASIASNELRYRDSTFDYKNVKLRKHAEYKTSMANQKAVEYGAELTRKRSRTHYWESVSRGLGSLVSGSGNFIGAFRPGANVFRKD
uniref:Minor capsid protein n=1 Tax=Microviridae sp. ctfUi1 TaxID=2826740 RepID=A0A8S5R1M8_9VIRU|nr:MAG TPA: Putative minor capsid protein [Microviridae sp. ctfUi1]